MRVDLDGHVMRRTEASHQLPPRDVAEDRRVGILEGIDDAVAVGLLLAAIVTGASSNCIR
jgi:hypothetical protein